MTDSDEEEDEFKSTGVYYSPQGKKELNKLKKSMTFGKKSNCRAGQ